MSMRFGLALLWFLATGSAALAQSPKQEEFDPYKGPTPIVGLYLTGHWIDDLPRFLLYEDRSVIYSNNPALSNVDYRTARLEKPAFDALIARVRALCSGARWGPRYSISAADHDVTTRVFVQLKDLTVATQVYGSVTDTADRRDVPLSPPFPSGTEANGPMPASLMELLTYLSKFEAAGSRPWQPEYLEVVLEAREDSEPVTASWPASWPSLKSKYARQGRRGRYSVFVPGGQVGTAKELMERGGNRAPVVLMDGRKWGLWYRYVYPGQPAWSRLSRQTPP